MKNGIRLSSIIYLILLPDILPIKVNSYAQGSFTPQGIDYPDDHPRLLFRKSELVELREKWKHAQSISPELEYVKNEIKRYSEGKSYLHHYSGGTVYKRSCANAVYATSAAFRYAMDGTDTHPGTGENFGDVACAIMTDKGEQACILRYPGMTAEHPGVGDNEKPSDYVDEKQLDGAFGLMHYCLVYDLLKGSGYFDAKPAAETEIRNLIIDFTSDYYTAVSKYGSFGGWWSISNHRVIAASAIGMAALTVNDAQSPDIRRQPLQWINFAMHQLYENLNSLAVPEGGWAEGPAYITYVFNGLIPFAWAHNLFTNGKSVLYGAVDNLPFKHYPATLYPTPAYFKHQDGGQDFIIKKLGEYMVKIRMPDGAKPNIEDGDYTPGWSPVLASLYRGSDVAPVFNWDWITMSAACKYECWWGDWELLFVGYDPDIGFASPRDINWAEASRVLHQQGIAVLRSSWGNSATYLALVGAYGTLNSINHQQADNTTFILARGQDVLVIDSGHHKWAARYHYNKASNHNRIFAKGADIPYLDCTDPREIISECPAYINVAASNRSFDYVQLYSPIHYVNAGNGFAVKFNTTRSVIFNHQDIEPYVILIDEIQNKMAQEEFVWRLHGHSDRDTANNNSVCKPSQLTCKWENIGKQDSPEKSQLEVSIASTAETDQFQVINDKFMHSYDAFHAFYYHDVLEMEFRVKPNTSEKIVSILRPGSQGADLLKVRNLKVEFQEKKPVARKLESEDNRRVKTIAVLYAQQVDSVNSRQLIYDPQGEIGVIALRGEVLVAKVEKDSNKLMAFAGQNINLVQYGETTIFETGTICGTAIVNFSDNEIDGFIALPGMMYSIDLSLNQPDFRNALPSQHKPVRIKVPLEYDSFCNQSSAHFTTNFMSTSDSDNAPATAFTLHQIHPNPFSAHTNIVYRVNKNTTIDIRIFNIKGQLVRELVHENRFAGYNYSVAWDGTDMLGQRVPSGVYVSILRAGDFTMSRKMLMIK
ncbi:T9SS type A sorting domain-containing protein [candidate division KSB1 bacterium]|nr:T9SS type A sorting domain-containing protein [candidate division KSB1 bacterium]